jgi:transcriptional regulator with XRE-family HTH domain
MSQGQFWLLTSHLRLLYIIYNTTGGETVTVETQNRFGTFFEELRQRSKLTLREFCKRAGCDPANISRMERGLMPPPKGRDILERYASVLGLEEATDDWYQFFDLAAADQGIVPADIMEDAELVKALPVFFRTLRGQKPTAEELRRIAEKIRKAGK